MLFKRNKRKTVEELEAQIRDLLAAEDVQRIPGTDAVAFNAAGDLWKEAGHLDRALTYYGLSIDAFLEADRWDSAAAICRKVIRLAPAVVRTRCTLAWLAIGKGMDTDAQALIRAYVEAAVHAGRDRMAVVQLWRMGEVAAHQDVRVTVAELLLELGADQSANELFGKIYEDRNNGRGDDVSTDLLWSHCRQAALLGPSELVFD
jgi:hypothetical protein